MLGCHDFNGYYEWTFHFLRRKYGQAAVDKYWSEAIALDSQQHYVKLGHDLGLRGLYQAWAKTGVEEQCDWTMTLAEEENLLRLDMFNCPSKGFLLEHDLNADEDYCDHCIGWIGPALVQIGAEVTNHEHNHCGQCWWEMRLANRKSQPILLENDIRQTPEWMEGYLHRFVHHEKQPLIPGDATIDSCAVLTDWFANAERLVVLGPTQNIDDEQSVTDADARIMSASRFLGEDVITKTPAAVVLHHLAETLPLVADKYLSTRKGQRPLLISAYLPNAAQDFVKYGLPRPVPLLPLLIRTGRYIHQPEEPGPSATAFAILLALALGKPGVVRDLPIETTEAAQQQWNIDAATIARAWNPTQDCIEFPPTLRQFMEVSEAENAC